MAAEILDGKAMAKRMRAELKEAFAKLAEQGHEAHLVSLSIGSDESSDWYVGNQQKVISISRILKIKDGTEVNAIEKKNLITNRNENDNLLFVAFPDHSLSTN